MKHLHTYPDYVTLLQIINDAKERASDTYGTFTQWLGDRSVDIFEHDPSKDHEPGNRSAHGRAIRVYSEGYQQTAKAHVWGALEAASTIFEMGRTEPIGALGWGELLAQQEAFERDPDGHFGPLCGELPNGNLIAIPRSDYEAFVKLIDQRHAATQAHPELKSVYVSMPEDQRKAYEAGKNTTKFEDAVAEAFTAKTGRKRGASWVRKHLGKMGLKAASSAQSARMQK